MLANVCEVEKVENNIKVLHQFLKFIVGKFLT